MNRASILAPALLLVAPASFAEERAVPVVIAQTDAAPAEPPTPPAEPAPAAAPAQPAPAAAAPAQPAPAATPTPQEKPKPRGRIYTWASAGTSFAYGNTYGTVSAGAGYIMQYGLAPNVELSYSFGSTPDLWTLRPGVTWFMPIPRFNPYVGAYYTHWFVGNGFPDQNGLGARAGLSVGRHISLSVTYDHALSCSHDCDIWTPQVGIGVSL